ncbi:MAG: hypothetical protein JXR46_13370 [Calditrichaceae bacterium]|nr:hypothetical protein [Calditrichaceae bacterium]MBN2710026.1 hypothetical protein [Calditrichaceae bacterium]RQV92125.1 MAG: hypothetical protein EH224_16410 [Calditrichota bacterium]
MQTKLTWKKNYFSNLYSIYSNGQQIGKLKDKAFSHIANGELNGKEYAFKTKGFFKQHTEIIDCSDNKVIGSIKYNTWMTKAEISINDKKINWKYDNIWNTRWSIFDSDGMTMAFNGTTTKGRIDSSIDDGALILSGLFVPNYYSQMTLFIIFIAVFVPIVIL